MASSSSPRNWRYNVFTSFHGPDVRQGFLSHLRQQFNYNGITMFDDNGMKRGHIPALIQAIRESRISIILLSKNYASSSWCLDELLEILECKEKMEQTVMTIFYGVDPSDVRHQTGEFGEAFNETCARKTEEHRRKWSEALTYVGNIAGEHFQNWDNEAENIEKIANDVLIKLTPTSFKDFDGIVGLEGHLKKMKSLLDLDNVGVKIVGISGPAGIGKSTIARALHSILSNSFEHICFMDNLKGSYKSGLDKYGLQLYLQEQLLSKVLKLEGIRISHLGVIRDRLQYQKVLIILDDVESLDQLEALADIRWFGPGSRVIVTTENKEILQQHGINDIYHVGFPSSSEALMIFCLSAFKQTFPPNGFMDLANEVVRISGNLPLGLHVLGSTLRGKSRADWIDELPRVKDCLDEKIESVLKVGFESLNEIDQALFLHIAVFYNNRHVDDVTSLLGKSKLDVRPGLKNLANRNLIHIDCEKRVVIHALLQQMAIQVISKKQLSKRRSSVDAEEIWDDLEFAKGNKSIVGVSFDNLVYIQIAKYLERKHDLPFLKVHDGRHTVRRKLNATPSILNKIDTFMTMRLNPLSRIKHLFQGEIVVRFLNLRYVDANEKSEVLHKIFKLPGVSGVVVDDSANIIVTGTVDPLTIQKALEKHRPLQVISRPMNSDKSDEDGVSELLDGELSVVEAYSDVMRSLLWTHEESQNSDLLTSGVEDAEILFRFTCPELGIEPMDSLGVTTDLKSASEMTGVTECILVFSCSDNIDVDETSFIEAISEELHKLEVTPLKYNLMGRENLDKEMLSKSNVGIMILSNSNVGSRQSLDHLVKIMEHLKATNHVLIPIYFKATLSEYMDSGQIDRDEKWKAAMAKIESMDGHEWKKEKQVVLVEEVVRHAWLRLQTCICIRESKNLVRILASLTQSHPSDAEIVGIWGMAGIGKTSIAKEIFGSLAPQYDLCYFVQDFYLTCQNKGLRQIREDFFSEVFMEEKLSISACDIKPSFMKNWFRNKKILVVLDDVRDARDVEAVVGGFGWFSHGHKIILTSRQKKVLVRCKVKEPYEIQKLCETESLRLCKLYLKESVVISELMRCSSGIPLALEGLGYSLSKQHINDMKEHLQRLRKNPPTKIQETFKTSFDGLDEKEKNIFLDVACFFKEENKDYVVQLLDACGFHTYLGISDLIDESLITLLDNRIEIPIPFQDIGRFIVHKESPNPCERSRLWESSDIIDVLTNNSGTEAIEGIFLDMSNLACELSPTVFGKMYNLRLLKFYCSTSTYGNECKLNLSQGLDTLPEELRLLHWENYPLKDLPQKFNPENLVEINMSYSNMEKLWEGKKNLEKLKNIKLSHSRKLIDIRMLSGALNLELIDLEGCTSLIDISTSIPRCGKLASLNMKDCSHLRSLPAMVDLTSLKLLNLSGCVEIEEIHDFAPNLKELYLAGTAITELPLSIKNLTELVMLDLENCKRLQQLPFEIRDWRSTVKLKLLGCTSLESHPKLVTRKRRRENQDEL